MEISNQKFNYPDLKDIKPRLVKQPISFNLDPQNKVYLTSNGEFYYSKFRGTDKDSGEEKWSEDLKFSAPLNGMSLVKQGDKWKIKYVFDKEERLDSIDTMLSLLANKLKLDTGASKLFAQFLYKFKTKREDDKDFEIAYEPIAVVDGIVRVNKTTDQPVKDILQVLIEVHQVSTYPDSFLTTLCYNMLAPFSYEIRMEGQKFPYRLSTGKTHAGKTSEHILVTLKGFDQSIKERKESLNTIKTIFTFGQQVERSRLPFLVDDINNVWIKYHSEELKGSTDSVKFMARGTKSQTQNVWDMVGMPIFTMNEEPSVPLALKDRLIMSHFTTENANRQNKKEFERLSDQITPGFMFNLIKETLDRTSISSILRDVHKSVQKDEEINQKIIEYAHNLLNKLAEKYSLKFPDMPKLDNENAGYDLLELFCTYVATRHNGRDKDGETSEKFSYHWNKETKDLEEVRITSAGYNDFLKEYKLKGLDEMTDFLNEVKNPKIRIDSPYVPTLKRTSRCIIIPAELISHEKAENEKRKKESNEETRKLLEE